MNLPEQDKLKIGQEVSQAVPTPALGTHAVNKDYVDSSIRVQGEQLPFISTWDVAASEEIVLPVGTEGNNSISVDWGDGTTNTEHSHTYTTEGTYNIEITGKLEDFRFNGSNVSKNKITAITQWGGIEWRRFNFHGCTNLTNIDAVDYPILNNVDSLYWAFGNCPITMIPEDIFTLASNVTDFRFVFRGHNATSIPPGLFDNCLSAVLFDSAFKNGSLTSIPAGLFRGCINARSFREAFRGNAIASVAEDIFANCLLVEDMSGVFFDNLITEVPSEIFKYNTKITTLFESFRYNNITATVPPIWLDFPNISGVNAFQHATGAPNYSEVPEAWGGEVGVPMPPQVPVDQRNYWNEDLNKPQWLINGVWYDAGTGGSSITNITEIPNRSYNDLQDLPNLYGRELKMIGSDTYQILNSDKDKFLWFVSNNNPQVSTANIFNQEDVIIGAFAGTNGGTFTQDFEKDPADAILEVPEGFTHRVKRNGHFKFKWDGIITGDFIKEYEITASPDGTLWKTGQVDNSGNPVAPEAL